MEAESERAATELRELEARFHSEGGPSLEVGAQPPGPPAGGGAVVPAPVVSAEMMAAQIGQVTFWLLAVRLGPHWKLSPEEQKIFGAGFAPIVAEILRRWPALLVQALVAVGTLGGILIPRLEEDARLEIARLRERKDGGTDAAQVEGTGGH